MLCLESVGYIALLLGGGSSENYKPDAADEGDEVDEKPPSALADVMHAADADCDAGNDVDEAEYAIENHADLAQAQQDCIYNNQIEYGIPVLSAGGAAVEVGIIAVETLYSFDKCDVHGCNFELVNIGRLEKRCVRKCRGFWRACIAGRRWS